MMRCFALVYAVVLCFSTQQAKCSHFDLPRIYFSGNFLADVGTINNEKTNYLISKFTASESGDTPLDISWNPTGTMEWAFVNCTITAATYKNGKTVYRSEDDPIIGKEIVNNPDRVPAKLVDLDVQHQLGSTIYGMTFGVNWNQNDRNRDAFIGDWTPTVITRDIWFRRQLKSGQTASSHGITRLKNVKWGKKSGESKAFKQLKREFENTGYLSVSVAVYDYSLVQSENTFTYGKVVGSIGVGFEKEPLSFVGNRVMHVNPEGTTVELPEGNPCGTATNTKDWMTTTYFTVHDHQYDSPEAGKNVPTVTVDFGNSFKLDSEGKLCKFTPLYLGILVVDSSITNPGHSVEIIDNIPYMEDGWYEGVAGIQDFDLTETQFEHSKGSEFVVVVMKNAQGAIDHGTYPFCSDDDEPTTSTECAHIVLKETTAHAQPVDYHIARLETGDKVSMKLLVRKFGEPLSGAKVQLEDRSPNSGEGSVASTGLDFSPVLETDGNGVAEFQFTATDHNSPRSNMDLDGQVYLLTYCIVSDCGPVNCAETISNFLAFFVWEKADEPTTPVFWDDHVEPIFRQYQDIYPAMNKILMLGDYDDVTKPHNLILLRKSMSLDINHPSHMPVTRDLAPSRRDLILRWLESEGLYRNWSHVEETRYKPPDFCNYKVYLEEDFSDKRMKVAFDIAGEDIYEESVMGHDSNARRFLDLSVAKSEDDKPKWKKEENKKTCSMESLKRDLQDAVTLEFATIPLYLTAMYSLKSGQNQEVYSVIRSVVMQEMLHMAQAANLLISLGGRPLVDDKNHVPQFPGRLPAGILPQLNVTLQKASPKHIHEVFMMIEFPHDERRHHPEVGDDQLTIGQFYRWIKKCMVELTKDKEKDIFCKGMTEKGCLDKQIHWPWKQFDATNTLYKVTDLKSAKKAIKMIVQQGEGAGEQNPTYLDTDRLAHFYMFEELACKHHMDVKHEHEYGFGGTDIEFTADGVWPMRDNPSKEGIPPGTQVYHKAKLFHRIYRNLLAKLQEMFDGSPEAIDDAVYLMESLQIHAKELMRTEIPSPLGWPRQTCGPVFDYEWDD